MAAVATWLGFLVFHLASLDVLAQNKTNTSSPSSAPLTEVPSVSFSVIPDHDLKQTDKSKLHNTISEESPFSQSPDMLVKSPHIQSDKKSLDPVHLDSEDNSQDNSNLDNPASKTHSPRLFQSISLKPTSHLLATLPNSHLNDLAPPHVSEKSMTLTTVAEDAQLHTSAPKPSFQQPVSEATEEINTNNLPDEDLDDDDDGIMEDKVGEETAKVPQDENDNTKKFPAGPVPKNESENSHFFAYLVTTAIVVAALYIAYHNKRKIIAFALEGKKSKVIRRPKSSDYQRLDQKI